MPSAPYSVDTPSSCCRSRATPWGKLGRVPKSRHRRKGKDRPRKRYLAVVPDVVQRPQRQHEPSTEELSPSPAVVKIDGRLLIFPHPYPEASRCVARTSAGHRCRNPIDYGQPTRWYEWPVTGGAVSGFDLDRDDELFLRRDPDPAALRRRWLEQRCMTHCGASAVNHTEPEWTIFDPARDSAFIQEPCSNRS